jgi:hypothetical protein
MEDIIMAKKNKNHHLELRGETWYFVAMANGKRLKNALSNSVTEARKIRDVTDRPKGARDDRANGATKSGSFSLLDGGHYSSFFALFSFVVFVPWGQFFGER